MFNVRISFWGVLLFLSANSVFPADDFEWHNSFAYDFGTNWLERIPVDIENSGSAELSGYPVIVEGFKHRSGDHPGMRRVVREDSREVLFSYAPPLGSSSRESITIPFEGKPGECVRYYIYRGNGGELPVQELLNYKVGLENPGFEIVPDLSVDGKTLQDSIPEGWKFDARREDYDVLLSNENPRSGKYCIKTVVRAGSEPSWIAIRQDRILIKPGAKYRFSAYVRGEEIEGYSGWYIHLGPEGKPFTDSPMLRTDEKNFDWKKLEIEFTAPADATIADLGTVLRGTGTAWFDDVSLELLESVDKDVKVKRGTVRKSPLKIVPENSLLENGDLRNDIPFPDGYESRSVFRIVNDSDTELETPSVLFDLRGTYAHGRIGTPCDIIIRSPDGNTSPGVLIDPIDRRVMAKLSNISSKSINFVYVYYRFDETDIPSERTVIHSGESTAHPELQLRADLPNPVINGGFENTAKNLAIAWEGNGTIESDPEIVRFGKNCAKIEVDEKTAKNWPGYRQDIAIEGGRAYLVSAWLRSRNMPGGARIHIHYHDENQQLCEPQGMTSFDQGVHGDSDWTNRSQIFTAPKDAVKMILHLTSNQPGTLWHDNIAVFDSLRAEFFKLENRPYDNTSLWQVPAVMKVFPETLPPEKIEKTARISAAGNEKEPLQLAFRSKSPGKFRLDISELNDDSGNLISAPEISIVDYVTIDYPSNYYSDRTPHRWHRKRPNVSPGCDGWSGLWPDPLAPGAEIEIRDEKTYAFWLTFSVSKNSEPGIYRTNIAVTDTEKGEKIAEMPLEFTVYDFTLPDENGVSATYDARFTGPQGSWKNNPWPEAYKLMCENRIEPDSILPEPSVSYRNGKIVFDWQKFDETARYLIEEKKVKFLYTPHLFYLFGWGHPPKEIFGQKPYEGD